jgi:hypothetical protein
MGDSCAHGGTIVVGCPTVLIGEVSGGGAGGGMVNVKAVIDVIDKIEGVEKSVLAEVKIVTAQIATMKNAAARGTALCHNPETCSQCCSS